MQTPEPLLHKRELYGNKSFEHFITNFQTHYYLENAPSHQVCKCRLRTTSCKFQVLNEILDTQDIPIIECK